MSNYKKLVRARREKTGESWATAARHLRAQVRCAPAPVVGPVEPALLELDGVDEEVAGVDALDASNVQEQVVVGQTEPAPPPSLVHWSVLRGFTSPPPMPAPEKLEALWRAKRKLAKLRGEPPPSEAPWPTAFTESIGDLLLADLLRWRLRQPWFTWPVEFRAPDGSVVTDPSAVDWQGFSELDARMAEVSRTVDILRKVTDALQAPVAPR
ncbi:hypothetical protein WME91_12500 [Sorangium sp. So ce269]